MFAFVKDKIAVKVALVVNLILFVVMAIGTFYMVKLLNQSLEDRLKEKAEILSIVGAAVVQTTLEEAIDNGALTVAEAFDQEYEEIPGFEPPKYHTKYDAYLDKALLKVQDSFLNDPSVVYAVAADSKGYVPTHNTRYQKPITGDKEKDKVGNRTKRVFNDPVGIKAAETEKEGYLQIYPRDTGEIMWDVSSIIKVKGKKWGAFRIGYSLVKIAEQKAALTSKLIIIMAIIFLISFVLVFVFVNRALKPVSHLTKVASKMADGDVNQIIEKQTTDEIGRLADVIERLRVSLKKAIDLIKEK